MYKWSYSEDWSQSPPSFGEGLCTETSVIISHVFLYLIQYTSQNLWLFEGIKWSQEH